MTEAKMIRSKCKKLTFRKSLCDETPISYFHEKDRFFIDTSKVYYDFQNTPMYKCKLSYGKEGYVAKEGVEIIVRRTKREHPPYNKKAKSR